MITLKSLASFSSAKDTTSQEIRNKNEDSFLSVTHTNKGYLFAVADGVGSYLGASEASSFVCNFLNSCKTINHAYIKKELGYELSRSFKDHFSDMQDEYRKAATTLSFCFLDDDGLSIWHAGDSRVYIQKEKKLLQLTSDHTQYQKLLDEKIYTKKELEEKNINKSTLLTAISMAVDLKEEYIFIPIDDLTMNYSENLSIVIMSDGAHHLWDKNRRFGDKTMSDIIKFSNALKRRIERYGASDDYTVVSATFDLK